MNKLYVCLLLVLLLTFVCLGGCTKKETPAAETGSQPPVMSVPPREPSTEPTKESRTETEAAQTLESLLGEDYVQFLTETITMQMEKRMEKNPEVSYYPIAEQAPLSDYAAIGETTRFEVDAEGRLVIIFPAGTVTALEHGEQRFIVIRVASAE